MGPGVEIKGFQIGDYRVHRRLGTGGMGEVWLAHRVDAPKRTLVLKTVLPHLADDPRFVELFLKEARIAASIISPRVVAISDLGEADGTLFLVLEYVDGVSLQGLLARRPPLEPALAAFIAAEICAGLDDISKQAGPDGKLLGVVHRDISPGNVLLSKTGEVKLSDFGIAKTASSDPQHLTTAGVARGKAGYMSPEQATGSPVDPRADLYSVGVVLYQMLSGALPYPFQSEMDLLAALVTGRRIPLREKAPGVPESLEAVVDRALQLDVARRYPDAASMRAALRALPLEDADSRAELARRVHESAARQARTPTVSPALAQNVDGPLTADVPVVKPASKGAAWLVVAAVLASVVAAGLWFRWLEKDPAAVTAGTAVRVQRGIQGEIQGGTARAEPRTAVEAPGSRPEPRTAVEAPARDETVSAPQGPAPGPDPVSSAEPARTDEDKAQFSDSRVRSLVLTTTPACEVSLNGHLLGASPVRVPVVGSRARLRLRSAALGIDTDYVLEPARGERARSIELGRGRLQLRVDPWAEVTLDGHPLGLTPLPVMDVFLGRHQLLLVNEGLKVQKTLQIDVEGSEVNVVRVWLP